MASGRLPFGGKTPADVASATLKESPLGNDPLTGRPPDGGSKGVTPHRGLKACITITLTIGLCVACADDPKAIPELVTPIYDEDSGRLRQLHYDADQDGTVDAWAYMDGTRLLRVEVDKDADGKIERWEYYDEAQELEKVGFSSANDGRVDTWAFEGPDGRIARIEISEERNGTINRWEYYEADALVRAESDSDGNGVVDKWEIFENNAVATVSFDEDGDGRPDRRLTYGAGATLLFIDSEPDASGTFTKKVTVGRPR